MHLRINIDIDIDKMKITAAHNFPEVLEDNAPEELLEIYGSVMQGVCRSFGGIIYALIEPKKDTVFYEKYKDRALYTISKSIDQELKLDAIRNKPVASH